MPRTTNSKRKPAAVPKKVAEPSAPAQKFGVGFATLTDTASSTAATTSTATSTTAAPTVVATDKMVVGKEECYARTKTGSESDAEDSKSTDEDTSEDVVTRTTQSTEAIVEVEARVPKLHNGCLHSQRITSNWFGPEVQVPSEWFFNGAVHGTYTTFNGAVSNPLLVGPTFEACKQASDCLALRQSNKVPATEEVLFYAHICNR